MSAPEPQTQVAPPPDLVNGCPNIRFSTPCDALLKKLLKASQDIDSVPKSGVNEELKYSYIKDCDLMKGARKALNGAGVIVLSTVLDKRREGHITTVTLGVTFLDTETGQWVWLAWQGEGADASDKGLYMAYTGGLKTCLQKQLLIPGDDDPEATNATGARSGAPSGKPEEPGRQRPARAPARPRRPDQPAARQDTAGKPDSGGKQNPPGTQDGSGGDPTVTSLSFKVTKNDGVIKLAQMAPHVGRKYRFVDGTSGGGDVRVLLWEEQAKVADAWTVGSMQNVAVTPATSANTYFLHAPTDKAA